MTGKPLLQPPHIQPARSSVTGPRRQRGQARTLDNEFGLDKCRNAGGMQAGGQIATGR